ncbi:MAG: ribbon-helix-helix domain-containing protein [Promethearchaeota archaeon]
MEPVSTHVPDKDLKAINSLIKKGKYANRSEFIREAVRRLIRMEKLAVQKKKRISSDS